MLFEGSYYPTSKMNPSAETPDKSKENPDGINYYCEYCNKYGECLTVQEGESTIIVKPCTICAMDNGGVWGWKENEDETYEKIKTNGFLPGNDGISDVLLSHTPNTPKREYEPLMEEIILGYVQHGLYCHLRWEDIMDFEEGSSKNHGRPSNSFYRLGKGEVWHWWKLIRLGSVISSPSCEGTDDIFKSKLPKRFCKVLKEILTISHLRHRNEPWDEFWKTEIEPIDVTILYKNVMKKVLDRHVDACIYNETGIIPHRTIQEETYKCENYGIIDYVISDFELMGAPETIPSCERGIAWIFAHVDPDYYGNPSSPLPDPREYSEHIYVSYYKNINGRITCTQEILEIHDHDIFGTSLKMVIHETHDFYINEDICTLIPYSYDITSIFNQTWIRIKDYLSNYMGGFPGRFNDIPLEKYIHNSVLCHLTYQETDINSSRDYYNTCDYSSEYTFRVNFEIDNTWTNPNPESSIVLMSEIETITIPQVEYEIETDDEEITNEKNKKIKNHLMKIQEIIDDEVKSIVIEGTYLKIMDKLKDVYTELI